MTTTTRALPIAPGCAATTGRGWARTSWPALAAGAVVIPQAMAYATIAGLPVHVGLYTCLVPMLVYALIGGSRTLSVSTTSTIAVLDRVDPDRRRRGGRCRRPGEALATLTLIVGAFLVGARLLRLGGLIDNISEATLTGISQLAVESRTSSLISPWNGLGMGATSSSTGWPTTAAAGTCTWEDERRRRSTSGA